VSIFNSIEDHDQTRHLLGLSVPQYRQAYSDRTAWLMACLSELAYLRFNPLFSNEQLKDYFVKHVDRLLGEAKKSSLVKLIDAVGYDPDEEKKKLEEELSAINMTLVYPFDKDGTQVILVNMKSALILAFRGTEATSLKDIKADAKAVTTRCESGGNVHSGFKEAFDTVAVQVQQYLDKPEYAEKPLYITGHSLGGALATIAAKRLSHEGGIAACYTYGSPRVGDEDWIDDIKTPIYRVVNAADCVTMLPPGADTITILSWMVQFVPGIGKASRKFLLSKFSGYIHCGNMRFLTSVSKGAYRDAKLLYSVNLLTRILGVLKKKNPWTAYLADHSIAIYRKKLGHIAVQKNPDSL